MRVYKPRITRKQIDSIIALYGHGYGRRKIAKLTGINVSTVQRVLRKYNSHMYAS